MPTVTTETEITSMLSQMVTSRNSLVRAAVVGVAGTVASILLATPAFSQVGQQSNSQQNNSSTPESRAGAPTVAPSSVISVPEDFAGMKLAPGFLLNIVVYDEPDFTGPTRVDNDGNINLAFLKPIHVAGDTVGQAKDRIQKAFRDQGILKNPQISLDVQQFATTTATVMGEVQNPGKVELLAPHSLLEVLGMVGGETALAGNVIELKRADGDPPVKAFHYARGGDSAEIRDVMVHPGDTVIVNRAGIVYVLGAVNRPGGYAMQEQGSLNVAQAISLAQGLTMQAHVSSLRVVKRQEDGRMLEVPVSYKDIMDGKEVPLNLSAGDIVYCPVNKVKTILGQTTGLVGQTAAAAIYVTH
jgi:polysaccharide biosynthesis/export protein